MNILSTRDLVRVKRSKTIREWMAPIIEEVGKGLSSPPIGYLTEVGGLPRVRVCTNSYTRCIPADFSDGDDFGDKQYANVFFEAFLRRHLKSRSYDLDRTLNRLGFGMHRAAWGPELWATLRSLVEDDSKARARELCEQIFEAGRSIRNDSAAASLVRTNNRRRNYFKFKRSVHSAMESGFSVVDLMNSINEVVVEDVMES